jgi:hypothetical protein
MSRNSLDPTAVAELAALDALLAGEPVDEEHLELAALVDSVRAQAPAFTAASAARVDARLAGARAPRRRRATAPRPRLALAGGTALALAIALAAVIGSGVLSGGAGHTAPPLEPRSGAVGAGGALHSFTVTPTASPGIVGATGSTTSQKSAAAVGNAARPLPNTNPSTRLVARNASLTLATTPAQMQTVANEVVSSAGRLGGIVESSNVSVRGMASYASFTLSVPSGRLASLIGALSSLAAVHSLDQGTSDITNTYDAAAATVAEEKAEHHGLLRALAAATTLAEQQAIEARISALDAKLAAASHRVGLLRSRGHNARVAVAIVPTRPVAGAGAGGPVNRALNDALAVLDVALAVALVALALLLPAGLVAIALWWTTVSLRQRSRERALQVTR